MSLSVAIDTRALARAMDGTKLHVLELIGAVARTGVELKVLVPAGLDDDTRRLLATVPEATLVPFPSPGVPPLARADVVHRPYQIDSPADLALLARVADRLLITQQDLIAYQSPPYFPSVEDWEGYRDLTRSALLAADRVLFFSAYVRDQALGEELVEAHRASLVPLGVDHPLTRSLRPDPVLPQAARVVPARAPVIACIGSDYRHKNRPFALRVASELRRRHGWPGWLVLAGRHMPWGSSREEELELLTADPELRAAFLDLEEIGEGEKRWLLERADLVLYPTTQEGFGLVPFEAADHGVPCVWEAQSALAELLPVDVAAVEPGDVEATAQAALRLMGEESERLRAVAAVRDAAARLTWERTGGQLLEAYRQTVEQPRAPAGSLLRSHGVMRPGFSEDAVRLVGPRGALPTELERPLLALASHRRLARPVLSTIRAGYRLTVWLRRDRRGRGRRD